jgi:hypothetical protein
MSEYDKQNMHTSFPSPSKHPVGKSKFSQHTDVSSAWETNAMKNSPRMSGMQDM